MSECKTCQEITAFENSLREQATILKKVVYDVCSPAIQRNNNRWRTYAWFCKIFILGDIIKKFVAMPFGLEPIPEYHNDSVLIKVSKEIARDAYVLEDMKGSHLEHWGGETVSPRDDSDTAGYYTPEKCPRKDCYEHGLKPFIPIEFQPLDYRFLEKNILVMCFETCEIMPRDRLYPAYGARTRYYKNHPSKRDQDPTYPGFNEWRTDEQVREARQKRAMQN